MWHGTSGDSRRSDIRYNAAAAAFAESVRYLAPSSADPAVNLMLYDVVDFSVYVPDTEQDMKVKRIAEYVNEHAGRTPVGPYGCAAYDGVWPAGLSIMDAETSGMSLS